MDLISVLKHKTNQTKQSYVSWLFSADYLLGNALPEARYTTAALEKSLWHFAREARESGLNHI